MTHVQPTLVTYYYYEASCMHLFLTTNLHVDLRVTTVLLHLLGPRGNEHAHFHFFG